MRRVVVPITALLTLIMVAGCTGSHGTTTPTASASHQDQLDKQLSYPANWQGHLTIQVSGPPTVHAADLVTLTVLVSNLTGDALDGYDLTAQLLESADGLSPLDFTAPKTIRPAVEAANSGLGWIVGPLTPKEQKTYTVSVTAPTTFRLAASKYCWTAYIGLTPEDPQKGSWSDNATKDACATIQH